MNVHEHAPWLYFIKLHYVKSGQGEGEAAKKGRKKMEKVHSPGMLYIFINENSVVFKGNRKAHEEHLHIYTDTTSVIGIIPGVGKTVFFSLLAYFSTSTAIQWKTFPSHSRRQSTNTYTNRYHSPFMVAVFHSQFTQIFQTWIFIENFFSHLFLSFFSRRPISFTNKKKFAFLFGFIF